MKTHITFLYWAFLRRAWQKITTSKQQKRCMHIRKGEKEASTWQRRRRGGDTATKNDARAVIDAAHKIANKHTRGTGWERRHWLNILITTVALPQASARANTLSEMNFMNALVIVAGRSPRQMPYQKKKKANKIKTRAQEKFSSRRILD